MIRLQRKILSQHILTASLVLAATPQLAIAQEQQTRRSSSALLEEVVITARKTEESQQSVPVAVTALGADQIDALKLRSLHDLNVGMPGVVLEDVATQRNTANFAVRGIGMRSSIASFDPAVGIFVDGVYMGLNNGIMLDAFDLESIQVLRGPQGTLFGRNTTGGAVLMSTAAPSDEFSARLRTAVDGNPNGDGGLNTYVMGAVSGPLSETLSGKLVAYWNDDEGWFANNGFDGGDAGANETQMFRGALKWTPSDRFEAIVRYEYNELDADGAVGQSHTNGNGIPGSPVNNVRNSFDFAIDERGYDLAETNFLTLEANWDVGFGDGTVTYIMGWRDFSSNTLVDVDSQPVWMFHAVTDIDYEQFSNELRYTGNFDRIAVTTGVMQFSNDLAYGEGRRLLGVATGGVAPALTQDGGGEQTTDSYSWFGSLDYDLNERLTLNAGINVTWEEKDAQVASLIFNVNSPCRVVDGTCPYDFSDDESWTNVSPKLGLTYAASDSTLAYGHWSRAFRSGLYNMRNTNPDTVNFGPGPTEPEQVDTFEAGFKHDLKGGGRVNAAAYYTMLKDAQRAVNVPDAASGVVQTFRNAGDIEVYGIEMDAQIPITDNLLLSANANYMDASWDKVGDLTGDGVADEEDLNLAIVSVPEWTYTLGLIHDLPIGSWNLTSRVTYAYRDFMYTTDNNLGFSEELDMLSAGMDLYSGDGRWTLSVYGRNLLNEVNFGANDTQLPTALGGVPLGGTFSPMQKGRVVGFQVEYNFL